MNSMKVEIKNLNTAKLPRLNQKDQEELLRKVKNGDEGAREEFIFANLRLVLSIVQKFNNRGENVDDIFQIGVVGLLKSIDNFDVTQNVQFSTYAVPMIIGEIKRFLRDSSPVRISRSLRDLAYKIMKEKESYVNLHNAEPTVDKLCEILGEPREEIVMALDSMMQPVSLYDTVYSDSKDTICLMDQIKDDKNEAEMLTDRIVVEAAISRLTDKEKNVIQKRFFDNRTQVELAEEIGVSQAQISRIEKTALHKMRKRLEKN